MSLEAAIFAALAAVTVVGDEWATLVNTLLLAILGVLAQRNSHRSRTMGQAVDATRVTVDAARSEAGENQGQARLAASNAEHAATAAADTARLTRDASTAVREEIQLASSKADRAAAAAADTARIAKEIGDAIRAAQPPKANAKEIGVAIHEAQRQDPTNGT